MSAPMDFDSVTFRQALDRHFHADEQGAEVDGYPEWDCGCDADLCDRHAAMAEVLS